MDSIYAELDLYVQSSVTEGLSTALLEAMSHGVAVAASDAGGTGEAVSDGRTGLLVPKGDSEALAAAIAALARDGKLRRRLGDAGRNRVRAEFDADSVARKYEAVYTHLATTTPIPERRA
jgi:glycosyltransferase involved in cell wall biosynthesis